jgi:hypothetical protein
MEVLVALIAAFAVEVIMDCVSVTVIIEGRTVPVRVADGMKGGVGERITGRGDGETTGVEITNGIFIPEHAARKKRIIRTRIVFTMSASD